MPEKIPKAMAEKFAAITTLTDAFSAEYLNEEYRQVRGRSGPAGQAAPRQDAEADRQAVRPPHRDGLHAGASRAWLNIAEIELAVLSNSCLSKRIPDAETLQRKVDANVRDRNAKAIPVKWRFTTQEARRKLARLYPCVST